MTESAKDRPYRFWLPFTMSVFTFLANVAIAIGLFVFAHNRDSDGAQPSLKQIGAIPQFPAENGLRTIRVKNFSTRQDAVVTRVAFVITDEGFLDCIRKRDPFIKNSPPLLQFENISRGDQVLEFLAGEWAPDGHSYHFYADTDIRIRPGTADAIRVTIGTPIDHGPLWNNAWFEGDLVVSYDDKAITIPNVIVVHKDLKGIGDIPPNW